MSHDHSEDEEIRLMLRCLALGTLFLICHLVFHFLAPDEEITHGITAIIAMLIISIPIISEAREHLSEGKFGMNELVLLAMAGCCAQTNYFDAAVIGIIMTAHEMIEHWTPSGSGDSLAGALLLRKKEIIKVSGEEEVVVFAEALNAGDIIKVKPGEMFAVDGEIISGESVVNNAAITGESVALDVSSGDEVLAGALNLSGHLTIKVKAESSNTMIAQMDKILDKAKHTKSEFISMVNKLSAPYALCVVGACGAVFFFTQDANRAISLMIVSFPDAFVMASPLAMLAAITSCARCGVLLKSPRSLMNIHNCDAVLLDKTGTITGEKLAVVGRYASDNCQDTLNDYSIALARMSNHPVAQAVAGMHPQYTYDVKQFQESHGMGVCGFIDGNEVHMGRYKWIKEICSVDFSIPSDQSIVAVAINGHFAGYFIVEDYVRPEAQAAFDQLLHKSPISLKMLSGDLVGRVKKIAGELKLQFRGECLPADKVEEIEKLNQNSKVIFVGDGLNDAPAMAVADVGISMNTASSELASNHADIILLGNNLHCLPYLRELSKKTNQVIMQNMICGAVFVILGVFLAGSNLLPPAFAAVFHLLDAIFIVLNSARLIKVNVTHLDESNTASETSNAIDEADSIALVANT